MVEIIEFDGYCKIKSLSGLSDPEDILQKLDAELSFKIQGAEHSKYFKGYLNERGEQVMWDGMRHLLKSNLTFSRGLLERVLKFFSDRDIPVDFIDKRVMVSQPKPMDIYPALKKMGIVPRGYQENAADVAIGHKRGVLRLATGAGKSVLAALIAAKLGKPTIIYVIGKDLLYQFHKLFSNIFEEHKIGIIGDGKCEISDTINIATIWSVGSALGISKYTDLDEELPEEISLSRDRFRDVKKMLLNMSVHIIDECHICACETVQEIESHVKAEHFYGMSASPWREDGADLLIEAVLGNRIVDISAKFLIDKGYLVKPVIRFLTVPKYVPDDPKKKPVYKTVYKNYITVNRKRNEMIAKGAEKLVSQGYNVLVLFSSKAHGKRLYEMISERIPCGMLSGDNDMDARNKVCEQLNNGDIKCIVASTIFDIGVDLPKLSALIIGSGGKSSVRAYQRVGRVIRLYPGKKIAPVIDFVDQAPYLYRHSLRRAEILKEEFDVDWPTTS